eukprot:jgi/Chlat1/7862/Chrsp66S07303
MVEEATATAVEVAEGPTSAGVDKKGGSANAGAASGPKARVKRLDKPNRESLDAEITRLEGEISRSQLRINEIKGLIELAKDGRRSAGAGSGQVRARLAELRAEFRARVEEKQALRDELKHADAARKTMSEEARQIKDKLPFVKVEEIDGEINKLEYKLSHTTMALQEEKRILAQIKELKKSRDFVKDYTIRLEKLSVDEGNRSEIFDAIKLKDEEINAIKEQENVQRALLEQMKLKEDSEGADIPALAEERQALWETIVAARDALRAAKTEFRAKEDEYYQREREFRQQQQEERQRRWEQGQQERKARDEARKERAAEYAVEPYAVEITICEQLVSYLQKVAPVDSTVEEVVAAKEIVAPKGVGEMLVSKKNKGDEELDSWFGGLGKKKQDKKKTASKPKAPEKLKHSYDALKSFQTIGVDSPATTADALPCIDKIKDKMAHYHQLRKDKAENGNAEPEAPAAEDLPEMDETDDLCSEASSVSVTLTADSMNAVVVELTVN